MTISLEQVKKFYGQKKTEMDKKQLGINIDNYVNKLVGIDGKYYNTGVMLVDIQKYNEFSNFEDLIEIALKNKYINIEQDVLNNVFRKHFYKLPSIYNFEIYSLIYVEHPSHIKII